MPVSGAWQPKIRGAHIERPMISFRKTYGMKPSPVPPASGPMNGAHSPCSLTFACSERSRPSAASSSRSSAGSFG